MNKLVNVGILKELLGNNPNNTFRGEDCASPSEAHSSPANLEGAS